MKKRKKRPAVKINWQELILMKLVDLLVGLILLVIDKFLG